MMRVIVILLAWCIASGDGVGTQSVAVGADVSNALVRMRVGKVAENGGEVQCELVISEVYSGPASYRGASVVLVQPSSGESVLRAIAFWPLLKAGEEVVGFVGDEDGKLYFGVSANAAATWIELPARQGPGVEPSLHFLEAVDWARTYAEFEALPANERPQFLQRHIRSESPVNSKWAASLLGNVGGVYSDLEYLRELATSESVAIHVRLAADERLAAASGSGEVDWLGSQDRKRLLLDIASKRLTSDEVRSLGRQTLRGIANREFEKDVYTQIARSLNEHLGADDERGRRIVAAIRERTETWKPNGDRGDQPVVSP